MKRVSGLAQAALGGIGGAARKARDTISDVRSPCALCGAKKLTLTSFCASCEETGAAALEAYRGQLQAALDGDGPGSRLWVRAHNDLGEAGVERRLGLRATEDLRLTWLREMVDAGHEQDVSPAQLAAFEQQLALLELKAEAAEPLAREYRQAFRLSELRAGRLPTVQVEDLVLPADEHCFYNEPAKRIQDLPNRIDLEHDGRLVVTDKKIRFVSLSFGGEVPLTGVLGVERSDDSKSVLRATHAGLAGKLVLPDYAYFEELLDLVLLAYLDETSAEG